MESDIGLHVSHIIDRSAILPAHGSNITQAKSFGDEQGYFVFAVLRKRRVSSVHHDILENLTHPTSRLATPQYNSTALLSCFFSTYSPSVCAT
jgi:hypothetical protein